jgi:hypothetical protein
MQPSALIFTNCRLSGVVTINRTTLGRSLIGWSFQAPGPTGCADQPSVRQRKLLRTRTRCRLGRPSKIETISSGRLACLGYT